MINLSGHLARGRQKIALNCALTLGRRLAYIQLQIMAIMENATLIVTKTCLRCCYKIIIPNLHGLIAMLLSSCLYVFAILDNVLEYSDK